MKILVIGQGGREHALAWKIAQSKKADKVFCAPGNGGTSVIAENVDIKADNIDALLDFSVKKGVDLVVVGPEAALASGIVDRFEKKGIRIFGPAKNTARLESSKVFAKETMRRFGVPTADFEVFTDAKKAKKYLQEKNNFPVVIKADGLAAGKGVIIANTREEAEEALKRIMEDREFGSSGDKVIIEECLAGEEASIIVVSDGENIVPLASSQDHKRVFDKDMGPNTGGMGAYSPAPVVTDRIFKQCMDEIVTPIIKGMAKDGTPHKGVLYVGVMVTPDGPRVLEFNVRFGDPETQAVLPRLKSDLTELMERSIDGKLKGMELDWRSEACVSVVMASGGYPGKYQKGKEISGLDGAKDMPDVVVFHAGTREKDGKFFTDGGRVLNVSALGPGIKEAVDLSYRACGMIKFEGMHYRRDIGRRALGKRSCEPRRREAISIL